ncbi:hypothetical protein ACFLT9_00450 [Acidobacteriota bacterium]
MANGADIETVRSILGHSSLTITQRYVHSNDERKRKAVELLEQNQIEIPEKKANLLHPRYTDQKGAVEDSEKTATKCLFSMN